MPKIAYITRKFQDDTAVIIARANKVINAFAAQGFDGVGCRVVGLAGVEHAVDG